MAGNGHWQGEPSVDQDGLLPVVKFLQSALAMKAKVRRILAIARSFSVWDHDHNPFFVFMLEGKMVCSLL